MNENGKLAYKEKNREINSQSKEVQEQVGRIWDRKISRDIKENKLFVVKVNSEKRVKEAYGNESKG